MGGAFVSVVDDATSALWNPAGLVGVTEPEAVLSVVEWVADIRYSNACVAFPVAALDGTIGLQFGSLGTTIEETDEYHPYADGTGPTFTFDDWLGGLSYARHFTDRFSAGFTFKLFREALGTEIGGPTTTSWLMDAGTWYDVGVSGLRLGVTILNFGPELQPDGHYIDQTGAHVEYQGFAAPTTFKAGLAISPIQRPGCRLTTALELNHPADNSEAWLLGNELWLGDAIALRAGYNAGADEFKFSAGLGVRASLGSTKGTIDYAYTSGQYLGRVDRLSLGFSF